MPDPRQPSRRSKRRRVAEEPGGARALALLETVRQALDGEDGPTGDDAAAAAHNPNDQPASADGGPSEEATRLEAGREDAGGANGAAPSSQPAAGPSPHAPSPARALGRAARGRSHKRQQEQGPGAEDGAASPLAHLAAAGEHLDVAAAAAEASSTPNVKQEDGVADVKDEAPRQQPQQQDDDSARGLGTDGAGAPPSLKAPDASGSDELQDAHLLMPPPWQQQQQQQQHEQQHEQQAGGASGSAGASPPGAEAVEGSVGVVALDAVEELEAEEREEEEEAAAVELGAMGAAGGRHHHQHPHHVAAAAAAARKKAPSSKTSVPGGPCAHCGARESPQWRRPMTRKITLCNSCGIFYSRHHSLPKRKKATGGVASRGGKAAAAARVGAAGGAASIICDEKLDADDGGVGELPSPPAGSALPGSSRGGGAGGAAASALQDQKSGVYPSAMGAPQGRVFTAQLGGFGAKAGEPSTGPGRVALSVPLNGLTMPMPLSLNVVVESFLHHPTAVRW